MSDTVKPGNRVAIEYVGRLEDGTVFDSSEGRDPLEFEAGSGTIIEGMNKAVLGMQVGEKKTVEIPPEESYGDHNQELMVRVNATQIPEDAKVGDVLSDGNPSSPRWTVVERNDEGVVLDGNHPLAGKTLIFDLTVVGIQ